MPYSPIDIANKIIARTDAEQGEIISNLKLQKLLYYLQGYFLAIHGEPLFEGKIEAWQYGPVSREAYFYFKDYGSGALQLREGAQIPELSQEHEQLFSEVLKEYGQFSAIKLMDMTHEETPWETVFSSTPQGEIDHKILIDFFKTQIEE